MLSSCLNPVARRILYVMRFGSFDILPQVIKSTQNKAMHKRGLTHFTCKSKTVVTRSMTYEIRRPHVFTRVQGNFHIVSSPMIGFHGRILQLYCMNCELMQSFTRFCHLRGRILLGTFCLKITLVFFLAIEIRDRSVRRTGHVARSKTSGVMAP